MPQSREARAARKAVRALQQRLSGLVGEENTPPSATIAEWPGDQGQHNPRYQRHAEHGTDGHRRPAERTQIQGKVYGERRQLILKLLQETLSDWLTPLPSFYGMHLTALARHPIDLNAITHSLLAQGVGIHTLDRYHAGRTSNAGLVLGYGAVESRDIAHGAALLRRALTRPLPGSWLRA